MKHAWMGLCLGLVAGVAQAENLDLDLSSRAFHGSFNGPLTSIFPRLSGLYELGGLAGQADAAHYREAHVGFLATGDAGAQKANVIAGLGARVTLLDVRDRGAKQAGGALALGGLVEARLPAFNRFGMRVSLYGAPKASSFGDLKSYLECIVDADYQVLRSASIYGGYRGLRIGVQNSGTETVDTGLHLGMRLNF